MSDETQATPASQEAITQAPDLLEGASSKVFNQLSESLPGRAFDVGFILRIAEILLPLLEECQARRAGQAIESHGQRRSFLARIRTRKAVRSQLDKSEWREYGPKLVDAILDSAEASSSGEIQALVQEVTG